MRFSRWAVPASLVGLMILLGGCGSKAPAYNQTPAITGIIPSNITVGSQDFTVFISGTGFLSNAKAGGKCCVSFGYWNGSPRSTTYNVQTGQLQMTVLASDVTVPKQAQITVVNPPPGGGQSLAAATFYVEPLPANGLSISSLSPSSVPVQKNSTPPPLITITGSNFVVGDVVSWNGQYRGNASSYLDQNTMTIQPTTTDVASAGFASISVSDSGLVNASPSVDLPITGPNAASPTLTSLTPSSATAGAADLEVLVNGSGFVFNSTVLWNSVPVATAYLSAKQLEALVPAVDLVSAGSADVSVTTPAPGGGTSSTSTFTINAP